MKEDILVWWKFALWRRVCSWEIRCGPWNWVLPKAHLIYLINKLLPWEHLSATLFGIPVQQCKYLIGQLYGSESVCWVTSQDDLLKFKISIRMGVLCEMRLFFSWKKKKKKLSMNRNWVVHQKQLCWKLVLPLCATTSKMYAIKIRQNIWSWIENKHCDWLTGTWTELSRSTLVCVMGFVGSDSWL